MRWFVEISSIGASSDSPVKLCVEAPQWQPALQKARASRGDEGPLNNFSIEVLDEGYRAVDPATRQRYFVRKAPDDAPLTTSAPAAAPAAPAAPVGKPQPMLEDHPAPKMRAPMQTSPFGSSGDATVRPDAETPAPPVSRPLPPKKSTVQGMPAVTGVAPRKPTVAGMAAVSAPSATPAPAPTQPRSITPAPTTTQPKATAPAAAVVAHKVHSSREENATSSSPLTYREFIYVVAQGTTEDAAKTLLLDRLDNLVKNLGNAQNKLVHLAVFDHAYQGRPQNKPLATLAWKDWRGEPQIVFPGREDANASEVAKETAPPAQAKSTPPPARTKSTPPPAKVSVTPPPPRASVPAPALKPSPSVAPGAPKIPAPAARLSTPAPPKASVPPGRIKSADEVMAELSGAITDLHFLRDALEGADFIMTLVKEKFPSDVVLVWFHDTAKRELVLVRQTGGTTDQHLSRMSDKAGLAQAALRSQRAVVIPDATRDPRANEPRWKTMGIEPKSIVVAPVMHSGKPYGLLEILNPKGGGRYTTVENNGLTYLGQQLAEFIATNGVILDSDRIMAGAKRIAS
jgi:putative methionine-R-sulfoxide reductase with GAF domain